MEPIKPGYKTTEFWVTVATTVVGFAAALGLIPVDKATAYSQIAVQIGGLVAAGIAPVAYSVSRGQAKKGK